LTIEFKHVRRSLVETEAALSFAVGFLQQLSLWQFALCAFDGDVHLNNMQTIKMRAVKNHKLPHHMNEESTMPAIAHCVALTYVAPSCIVCSDGQNLPGN